MATRPLVTVPADAFAFLAMARMNRLRIRHLGVADATGRVVGALSARDLLRLRAEGSIELGDEIDQAADVHDLAGAWAKLPQVVAGLVGEGLSGNEIATLISHQLGAVADHVDKLVVVAGHDHPVAVGPRAELLTSERLSKIYERPIVVRAVDGHSVIYVGEPR